MEENKFQNFFEVMQHDIMAADIPEEERQKLLSNYLMLKDKKVNLLITGATGCGKSSTINALFGCEKATVGVGVEPQTMGIEKYEMENLTLWDSPGLGDGKEKDTRHAKNIIAKLLERDEDGNFLIDLVLVILDGSSRDLGTSYELINQVIIPNLGDDKENRILVAINQADMAMKGRYWNAEENRPEAPLVKFLDEKVESVRSRIKEATGVDVTPIYYCAGYKEEGMLQCKPYNLAKLLYFIVEHTPNEKRIAYIDHINQDTEVWRDNDDVRNYRNDLLGSIFGFVGNSILKKLPLTTPLAGVVPGVAGLLPGVVRGVSNFIDDPDSAMMDLDDLVYDSVMGVLDKAEDVMDKFVDFLDWLW